MLHSAVLRKAPFILPAQPTARSRPPSGAAWVHEVKFDGYRCQLHRDGESAVIYSQNGREFTNRFPLIHDALLMLPTKSAVIDAEVVACNDAGVPDFRALHSGNYAHEQLRMWCFDLLLLNGNDLRPMPLVARKLRLEGLLRRDNRGWLLYSESFTNPELLLLECRKRGLEGIVSKKKDAPYRSGKCDWIKVKCTEWREANKNRGDLFQQRR